MNPFESLPGLFVTGTDTGVGKTVVAAMLALGLDGFYWKPIQSGDIDGTDRSSVAQWTGLAPERLLPEAYCLRLPASPHLAAAAEGVRIDLDRCALPAAWNFSSKSPTDKEFPAEIPPKNARRRPLIIEGAGGLLVPLNERDLMIDLIARLGLPVVLVARSTLGTINHTLLSLAALRARRLPLAAVVLNGPPHPENEAAIRKYGRVESLFTLPPLAPLDAPRLRAAFARLAAS